MGDDTVQFAKSARPIGGVLTSPTIFPCCFLCFCPRLLCTILVRQLFGLIGMVLGGFGLTHHPAFLSQAKGPRIEADHGTAINHVGDVCLQPHPGVLAVVHLFCLLKSCDLQYRCACLLGGASTPSLLLISWRCVLLKGALW